MTGGAWLCLLAPLAGTIAILLAGTRIPRQAAGWISTASVFAAFGGAVWAFFSLRAQSGHDGEITTAWTWLESGSFSAGLQLLVDALVRDPGHGAVLLVARPQADPVPALRELAGSIRLPGDAG